jgi:hypothetical protein
MTLALITRNKTRIDCTDVEVGEPVVTFTTALDADVIAEAIDLGQLGLDGEDLVFTDLDSIASDETFVGKIDTKFPRGNVASLIKSGMLQVVEIDDLKPSTRKKVAPKASSKKPVTTKPSAPATDTTEDDLDEDLDEDEPTSDQPQGDSTGSPVAEVAKTLDPIAIDPSLVGIPQRIAEALVKSQLTTKAELESYVASGKKLIDLDGIGPRTEMHLQNWLAGQPWPDK